MPLPPTSRPGLDLGTELCYFCNQPKAVSLRGRLSSEPSPTRATVVNMIPCDRCKKLMERGVILISVKDHEMDKMAAEMKAAIETQTPYIPNPYRSGGWVVVSDESIRRMVADDALRDRILKKRWTFVPDRVWGALGFPRSKRRVETHG